MAEKEEQQQAVKEVAETKEDEIDKIISEFFKEDAAKEAEQAAKREERRGE